MQTAKHVSHYLLVKTINDRDWDEACSIAYNDEEYARIKDSAGNYPIHLVVKGGGPTRLVVLLLTAFPECVAIKDPLGSLPIHLAAVHHKGRLWVSISEITTTLFAAYPQGIREPDGSGNLAIHIALRHRGPDELIKFLLMQAPDTAHLEDTAGNICLHLAVQFEASIEVIKLIMELYPKGIKTKNSIGCLVLHKVAQFNPPIDIFKLILDADTAAATVPDNRGNLPLHLCFLFCGGPPDEERLRLLLQAAPMALGTRNNKGLTPFQMMNRPEDHSVHDYN